MNTKPQKNSIDEINFKELSKSCKTQEDLSALTKQFMKQTIEGMLQAELEEHLDQDEDSSKNGTYPKTVRSDAGELRLDIPRDRKSKYSPQLIPKGQRTISGIDSI